MGPNFAPITRKKPARFILERGILTYWTFSSTPSSSPVRGSRAVATREKKNVQQKSETKYTNKTPMSINRTNAFLLPAFQGDQPHISGAAAATAGPALNTRLRWQKTQLACVTRTSGITETGSEIQEASRNHQSHIAAFTDFLFSHSTAGT